MFSPLGGKWQESLITQPKLSRLRCTATGTVILFADRSLIVIHSFDAQFKSTAPHSHRLELFSEEMVT